MSTLPNTCKIASLLAITLGLFTGCESTDSGSASVSGGVYYGVGFYDTWYHGDYYPPDVIVTPPPSGERPGNIGAHPEHPIAKPPSVSPSPRSMPSIPSAPRPMARPAMRR